MSEEKDISEPRNEAYPDHGLIVVRYFQMESHSPALALQCYERPGTQ